MSHSLPRTVHWRGLDEWEICAQDPELATRHEGEARYPACFRNSSEIRLPEAHTDPDRPAGRNRRSYLYAVLDGKPS